MILWALKQEVIVYEEKCGNRAMGLTVGIEANILSLEEW